MGRHVVIMLSRFSRADLPTSFVLPTPCSNLEILAHQNVLSYQHIIFFFVLNNLYFILNLRISLLKCMGRRYTITKLNVLLMHSLGEKNKTCIVS